METPKFEVFFRQYDILPEKLKRLKIESFPHLKLDNPLEDTVDAACLHFFIRIEDEIVGYARLAEYSQGLKSRWGKYLDRVCIKKEYQNKGLFTALMAAIENYALSNPGSYIWLKVRKKLVGYYQKLGYNYFHQDNEFLYMKKFYTQ